MTGVELGECVGVSCRSYSRGDYTLLGSHDQLEHAVLDVYLTLRVTNGQQEEHGGAIVYVRGEDTLLSLMPANTNTLNVVYRDEDTQAFVQYVNYHAPHGSERIIWHAQFSVCEDD